MKIGELKKEIIDIISMNNILQEERNFLFRCLAIISKEGVKEDEEVIDVDQLEIINMFKKYREQMSGCKNTEVIQRRMERCMSLLDSFADAQGDKNRIKKIGHDLTKLLVDSGVDVTPNTSTIQIERGSKDEL